MCNKRTMFYLYCARGSAEVIVGAAGGMGASNLSTHAVSPRREAGESEDSLREC